MLIGKFLDPKNDFAFKRIFGTPRNKDILIHFINDILKFEGEYRVVEVSFLKTIQDPEIASKKQSLVDVLCTDQVGRQYIIEMQVAKVKGFEKRAQYYAAKAYSQQLARGENYQQLKEVIFIAITDFVMFEDKLGYYSNHYLLDGESHSRDLKDFSFTFVELPKFHKGMDELTTLIDKWAYFFKHAEETREEELDKIIGHDEVIEKAYQELNRHAWSEEELNTYEEEEKRERDAQAIIAQKLDDAEAKGRAKGKAEGEAIGEARGRTEGKAEGRAEGIDYLLQAVELLKAGHSLKEASERTGISLEVLEKLR